MQPSSKIHTVSQRIKKEYKKDLVEENNNIYVNKSLAIKFFQYIDRNLLEKDIDFRRKDSLFLGQEKVNPELKNKRIKGQGNRLFFSLSELENYALKLSERSIDLTYLDAKAVIEGYDSVLMQPKKYGMRGQRNFTGKVEDEVRGKLAEHGFSKYINNLATIELPVDYSSLEQSAQKRDTGDFTKVTIHKKMYDLPEKYIISLKSTNGNYLAVPENEIDWEGNLFVFVKLHIKETFLYRTIKAGLEIEDLDLKKSLGWLEFRGFIKKSEFRKSYQDTALPDGTKFNDKINLIKAPSQLNQNSEDLKREMILLKQELTGNS